MDINCRVLYRADVQRWILTADPWCGPLLPDLSWRRVRAGGHFRSLGARSPHRLPPGRTESTGGREKPRWFPVCSGVAVFQFDNKLVCGPFLWNIGAEIKVGAIVPSVWSLLGCGGGTFSSYSYPFLCLLRLLPHLFLQPFAGLVPSLPPTWIEHGCLSTCFASFFSTASHSPSLSLIFPWKINSFPMVSPSEGRPENLSDRAKEQKQGRNEGWCKLLWRCMTDPEPVNIDGGEVVTEIVGRRRWQDRVAVWWMVGNKRLVSLRSPPLSGVGTSVFVINGVWHGEQKFVLLLFSFSFVVLCSCLLCSTPVHWTAAVCWMYYSCFVHWTKMLD